jgi:hypothetical protein
MNKNKLLGGSVFLVGASIGATTRTDILDFLPFWAWLLVLFIAVVICNVGMTIWKKK